MSIMNYMPPLPNKEELERAHKREEMGPMELECYIDYLERQVEEYKRKYPDDSKPDHLK